MIDQTELPLARIAPSREQYLHSVRRVAEKRLAAGTDLDQVVFECRGAFPTDVLAALGIDLGNQIDFEPAAKPATLSGWRVGESDLIQSEWYFDERTVQELTAKATDRCGSLFAVGTPTIAVKAASLVDVTLLDSSPWISEDKLGALSFHRSRVEESRLDVGEEAVFIIDPPWHLQDYCGWLSTLEASLRPGSRVFLALPQMLSLRSAPVIRQFSIDFFSRRGVVDVIPDALTYESPPFEQNILGAAGLAPKKWRSGDLLEAQILWDSELAGSTSRDSNAQWRGFVIGGRVIRLRDDKAASGGDFDFIGARSASRRSMVLKSPSHSQVRESGLNAISSNGTGLRVASGLGVLESALARAAQIGSLTVALEEMSMIRKIAPAVIEALEVLIGTEDGGILD